MTVAPLIGMKGSAVESFKAIGMELDRRAHTYVNDVEDEHRHIGFCVRECDTSPLPLEQSLERRLGELNTKRKIRENQVKAMGFIISSNDHLPEREALEFLRDGIEWFGARYGYENLLAAEIHLDEGTPHAHIWLSPVIHDAETGYDRLCAKELFAPDKRQKLEDGTWVVTAQGTMSRLQEDFYEQVSSRWGYERPLTHEQRAEGYRSLEAYKVHVGVTRKLQAQITQAEQRLECVQEETRYVEQECKQLQPVAQSLPESLRTLSEARGLGEREEVLEREVAGLRSRVRAAEQRVEAQRADVGRLDTAIERGRERLAAVRLKLTQAIERMGAVPKTVSRATQELAAKLGKQLYNPRDYELRHTPRIENDRGMHLGL